MYNNGSEVWVGEMGRERENHEGSTEKEFSVIPY